MKVRRQFYTYEVVNPDEPTECGRGYVYFLQPVGGGLIKIGQTISPYKRFNELKNSSPVALGLLMLLKVTGSSRSAEIEFHRRFSHLRAHGEWFRPAPELADLVGGIAEQPEPPKPDPEPDPDAGLDSLAAAIAAA